MEARNKTTSKNWKELAVRRRIENSRLKQELKRQRLRALNWRSKFYDLRHKHDEKPVFHHYPLCIIWLAIYMHIHCNVSLRATAKTLVRVGHLLGYHFDQLHHCTIRNWCLRYGLFQLEQPLLPGDYVLIFDESFESSKELLLALLAVPLSDHLSTRPLEYQDCRVIGLGVRNRWNAKDAAELIRQAQRPGVDFKYGISDQCRMLKKAYEDVGVEQVLDCTHIVANTAKKLFRKHENFNSLIRRLNQLRAKWVMSKHNLYLPPRLRSKSRFHQFFCVATYAKGIIQQWEDLGQEARQELSFIKEQEELIQLIAGLQKVISRFFKLFKSKGLSQKSIGIWQRWSKAFVENLDFKCEEMKAFLKHIDHYLLNYQSKIDKGQWRICCSDIIESMFGKYKLKGQPVISEDVLKIAAFPSQITLDEVRQAMKTVSIKDLKKWKLKNTCKTRLAKLHARNRRTAKVAA